MNNIVYPPKPQPGDKVAILSPSFAAPAVAREIHEQALRRFAELTELVPVELPDHTEAGRFTGRARCRFQCSAR